MAETTPRGIQATLFDYFQDIEYFDLQEANELLLEHQQRDVNRESIRARIYEGIDKGLFERVGKGLYTVTRKDEQGRENTCLLINGDGRDLSFLPDASVDLVLTDHPYSLKKSLKGGNRNFADYELFQYNEQDLREKFRVLRQGCFCVEFLPEENADNYQYLYQVKEMARKAGFEYFAKVPWQKTGFVANTGRKSKNTEDIVFFSKGRARDLRPDAQKNKKYENSRTIVEYKEHVPGGSTVHYSDMGGMGTSSDTKIEPTDVDIRISVAKEDAEKAQKLLDDAFLDAFTLTDTPLDIDSGGDFTLDELFNMPTQEYMLRYLEAKGLSFVDLSPGPNDIFQSKSQVIVNPTNLIGPMGAGLAKSFKEKYPHLEHAYKESCRQRQFCSGVDGFKSKSDTGHKILMSERSALFEGDLFMFGSNPAEGRPAILCFPTKRDWKDPSSLDLIETGLKTFAENYKLFNIKSITFPKLGCGLGGLNWEKDVKPLMQKYLGSLPDLDVQICGDTLREDKKEHFMSGATGMLPTVFDIAPPNRRDRVHQAEKPQALLEQIIRFVTKEDELILDQFGGSGNTGKAALSTHRNSIIIEKDVETFNKMRENIEALGNVEVHTPEQKEAINVAIDVLEAAEDGPDALVSFVNYQDTHGMTLQEAMHTLEAIPVAKEEIGQAAAVRAATAAISSAVPDRSLNADKMAQSPVAQEHPQVTPDPINAAPVPASDIPEKKVLECSSRGDKRFSALYAKVTIKGKERSIEEFYQDAKRTADGKKAGKGKPFDHIIDPYTGDKLPAVDAADLYRGLWIAYLNKHPELVEFASQFDAFSDMFRGEKTVNCQADVISAYVANKEEFVASVKAGHWYQNIARKKTPLAHKIQNAETRQREQQGEQLNMFGDRLHYTRGLM